MVDPETEGVVIIGEIGGEAEEMVFSQFIIGLWMVET